MKLYVGIQICSQYRPFAYRSHEEDPMD